MGKKDYSSFTKDELIKEVESLKKQKTYGLVWEEDKTKENFDYYINWDGIKNKELFKDTENKFPVVKEIYANNLFFSKDSDYNLVIEGDNYHSLAVLNFTHKNSIDVIYIDPPYNTGNKDFKYNDQWVDKEDSYRHSKWLSFMEKRLKLTKDLLKKTGILIISIDDNEVAQLKLLCDELFGKENFIALMPRLTKKGGKSSDDISSNHDYVLIYTRTKKAVFNKIEHTDSGFKHKDEFFKERGLYKLNQTLDYDSIQYSRSLDYEINIGGTLMRPGGSTKQEMQKRQEKNPDRDFCWRWSKELFDFGLKNGFVVVKEYKNKSPRIYTKTYQNATISEDESNKYYVELLPRAKAISTIDFLDNAYSNDSAKKELKNYFGKVMFDYPKPTKLVEELIKITSNKNSIILDFFAGSGTTGDAVLKLNSEDGGKRKFILCTNNENGICAQVTYPRIEKVINGYTGFIDKLNYKGLKTNLKYYKTDFVDSKGTDKNKRKLVNESTDMLCIKESAFEKVVDKEEYKIFKNGKIHLGIIFDEDFVLDFIKDAKKIDNKINVYVFSLDASVPEDEFEEIKDKVNLCPIPEVILQVYRRVFKND